MQQDLGVCYQNSKTILDQLSTDADIDENDTSTGKRNLRKSNLICCNCAIVTGIGLLQPFF